MQNISELPIVLQPDGRVTLSVQQLKALRQRQGLSQEAVAEQCVERRLCLSLASIKRAESGKPVLYRTARHFAAFYGIAVEALIPPTRASHPLSELVLKLLKIGPSPLDGGMLEALVLGRCHELGLGGAQAAAFCALIQELNAAGVHERDLHVSL